MIGVFALIGCAACISLSGVVHEEKSLNVQQKQIDDEKLIQTWIPVTLAIMTTFFFTATGVINKYLT